MLTKALSSLLLITQSLAATLDFCPPHSVLIKAPDEECQSATDPRNLKESSIEEWFTKEMFEDLFPKANLGLGPHSCLPYSYESFIIAARYFPEFGGETLNKDYNASKHQRRDVAAFFAHALQETGENNIALYNSSLSIDEASECFYRGGFYNWFERGPNSSFLLPAFPGFQVVDGKRCTEEGQYCKKDAILNFWYPCNGDEETHANTTYKKGCYFGRGALQLSWNYNYGLFQQFLLTKGIKVDLINNPNLVRIYAQKHSWTNIVPWLLAVTVLPSLEFEPSSILPRSRMLVVFVAGQGFTERGFGHVAHHSPSFGFGTCSDGVPPIMGWQIIQYYFMSWKIVALINFSFFKLSIS
ncbi:chitinase class I [Ancylostoma duodenale]|uniref:Chitinase class I n=1 Tax=Ancylostoma duodenale TaxID=51022 RepID=A0A0C2C622_9BILA|nr:chitinase class I [Ancylostoma duodenale]